MTKRLFLDLEETVINSVNDLTLINVDVIKNIIAKAGVKMIYIFSFAIYNQDDVYKFEANIKPLLEDTFDVKVVTCVNVVDMLRLVGSFNKVSMPDFEIMSILGKLKIFQDYCTEMYSNCECILVDDVVPNTTFTHHDKNLVVSTVRVMSPKVQQVVTMVETILNG